MTYVHSAIVKRLNITHYVEKIKEHEARRASFNERQEYWRAYFDELDKSQDHTGVVTESSNLE